jgi:hypothetical protein
MKTVIVRLDLDRYRADTIARLVVDGMVGLEEATEARAIREMTDVVRLVWVRETVRERQIKGRFDKVS